MSDQNAAPEAGTQTPGQHPEPVSEPKVYTEADIHQMRIDGDHEGVRKAVEQLTRRAQGDDPVPADANAVPADDAGQPTDGDGAKPGEQKKVFEIPFRGQQRTFDDSDGYLGLGDFGKLKKSFAHSQAKLEDFESKMSQVSNKLEEALQQNRSLTEQNEALRARVQELESKPAPAPAQPAAPAPAPEAPKDVDIDIPEPPERPDIPDDPFSWDDEQQKLFKDWQSKRNAYDKKVTEVLRAVAKAKAAPTPPPAQPQPAQEPEAAADVDISKLPKDVQEAVRYFREKKRNDEREKQVQGRKAYWESFRAFQKEHQEFATPVDIEEMNRQVLSWMDRLAYANGYDLPAGASQEEKANYETIKRQLAFRYAKGDKQVLANSEGTPAPQGYEAFVKVANLDKIRKDLINRGVLGPEAGLHEAWLYHYSGNGMNEDIKALENNAATRGASDVIKSLESRQANNAVNLPNDMPAGNAPPAGASNGDEISQEEAARLVAMTPLELAQNPELAERRKVVIEALSRRAGYVA